LTREVVPKSTGSGRELNLITMQRGASFRRIEIVVLVIDIVTQYEVGQGHLRRQSSRESEM